MSDKEQTQDQNGENAKTSEEAAAANEAQAAEAGSSDRVAALEAEVADLKDRLARALAETENVRRRADKEKQDASKFGPAALARELFPVADNLSRALAAVPDSLRNGDDQAKNFILGVEMTEKLLQDAFEKQAIKRIDPLGEKFSYEHHQAMSEAVGTGKPAGTVVQVLQVGYMLHDRLLRPAMVVVAKGEANEGDKPGDMDHVDTTA